MFAGWGEPPLVYAVVAGSIIGDDGQPGDSLARAASRQTDDA